MKLKGIELKGTYKVIYYDTSGEVYDEKGNMIYYENSKGSWSKWEYDEKSNVIYREDSNGYWYRREHDEKGNEIYFEESNGYWVSGIIIDKRVKELTIEEIENLLGYKIKIKGERKLVKTN